MSQLENYKKKFTVKISPEQQVSDKLTDDRLTEEETNIIEQWNGETILVFTDGSVLKEVGRSGAGLFAITEITYMEIINKHIDRPTEFLVDELKKTDHIAKSYEIMEGLHNSFYSETIGVYQAFKLAKLLPDSEVKIILDNEAAQKIANKISHLKLQQLNKLEGRIIWNAIKKINDSLNTPPEVIWIKGHNGTPGNEYSDELAGKYKISQQTIKTYIPTSNADLPRNLRILNNKNHTFNKKPGQLSKGSNK